MAVLYARNLDTKLTFGGYKMSLFLPLLARILKVYSAEALPGFIQQLISKLYQGYSFEMAPTEGMVGRMDILRTGEGVRTL